MLYRVLYSLGLFFLATIAYAQETPSDTIILANANIPESVELAHYYAKKRNIPDANIVLLAPENKETISWDTFIKDILNPLKEEAYARHWLIGEDLKSQDAIGRKQYAIDNATVRYLVICKGIPLRIANDPGKAEKAKSNRNSTLSVNNASVDSELALLAVDGYRIQGPIPNPYFKNPPNIADVKPILITGRIDGPDFQILRAMIDRTLEAEENGLRGRAYIDIGGPYKDGNQWIEDSGNILRTEGFDTEWDKTPELFPSGSRFDEPAFYFGWYERSPKGIIAEDGIQFTPGALAFHLHSFSATTLLNPRQDWVPFLIARGASATWGNVYEPYLQFTHRTDILLKTLLKGETIGNATLFATPAFSWQGIFVGDPLYRPFKISLQEQVSRLKNEQADELQSYVVLRQLNTLVAKGSRETALTWAKKEYIRHPSLALAYRLGIEAETDNNTLSAKNFFSVASVRKNYSTGERYLLKLMADGSMRTNDSRSALAVYSSLLASKTIPSDLRKQLLEQGIAFAKENNEHTLFVKWTEELKSITEKENTKK